MSQNQSINEELMQAVSAFDLEGVRKCLSNGADPNYRRFRDEDEPNGLLQPTTPLRMVMFRISDNFLEDDDLREFAKIATLLLEHGADPKPAIEMSIPSYGKYNPTWEQNPLTEVYRIVATAQ